MVVASIKTSPTLHCEGEKHLILSGEKTSFCALKSPHGTCWSGLLNFYINAAHVCHIRVLGSNKLQFSGLNPEIFLERSPFCMTESFISQFYLKTL